MKKITLSLISVIFIISIYLIFKFSQIATKSYNVTEFYSANGIANNERQVLITENNNINGAIVSFGIVAGASLLCIITLILKDEKNDRRAPNQL